MSAMALSDLGNLEGSAVIASGEIEPITCPPTGNQDCLTWPSDIYRMPTQNICFTADVNCGYGCEGFMAEKDGKRAVYVINSAIGPRISKADTEALECPGEGQPVTTSREQEDPLSDLQLEQ